jgi:hypothetical protein
VQAAWRNYARPLEDEGEQGITGFHVTLHIAPHIWVEIWGFLQQKSGDGAKVRYENRVFLKVAMGHFS